MQIFCFIFLVYNIYMLNRVNKILAQGFAVEKKMFVYDSGKRDLSEDSGIRATIFGATGTRECKCRFYGYSHRCSFGQGWQQTHDASFL